METMVLAALFAATWGLLALVALRGLRCSPRRLAWCGRVVLQFAGLWTICLLANAGIGALAILAVRGLTGVFVSIYLVNDLSIVIVSALQAAFLQACLWRLR